MLTMKKSFLMYCIGLFFIGILTFIISVSISFISNSFYNIIFGVGLTIYFWVRIYLTFKNVKNGKIQFLNVRCTKIKRCSSAFIPKKYQDFSFEFQILDIPNNFFTMKMKNGKYQENCDYEFMIKSDTNNINKNIQDTIQDIFIFSCTTTIIKKDEIIDEHENEV